MPSVRVWAWIRAEAAVALFALAFILGCLQLRHPEFGLGQGFEMVTVARNLAAHGAFADPFPNVQTGPTAVVPPLYPLYLAAFIKFLGTSTLGGFALSLAGILVNALIAALMPRLSAAFCGDPVPGIFAGLLWIFAMRLMPEWDASYVVLGLALFSIFTARTIERRAWRWAAAAGALAGLLSLMNPMTVLAAIPWAAFLLWSRRLPFRHAARYGSILILALILCNLPWAARNYRIWHTPVLRTNFGMTIYSSNNSCAEASLIRNRGGNCYQTFHPVSSVSEARLLKDLGEVRYDRLRTADAIRWIRTHPGRFRQLTLARIAEFWFPAAAYSAAYSVWLATLLSVPGLILMARRRQPVTVFVVFVWLVYPLMYYIVVSSDRYRLPILWTTLLSAGYCIASLFRWRPAPE